MLRILTCTIVVVTAATAPAIDSPLAVGNRAQLLADRTIIQSSRNVAFTLHPGQKHSGNPLLKADLPWEGWRISLYGTVLYDEHAGLYKMWYTSDVSEDFPNYAVLYATSRDGLKWDKPLIGTAHARKTKHHNAVLGEAHLPSVFLDREEADPARRYKMLAYVHLTKPVGGPHVFASPDGLQWTKQSTEPICRSNDVITAFFDRERRQYVALPKLSTMVRGHVRRCFGLSTSADFVKWTEPRYILRPDLQDDGGSLKRIEEVRAQLDVPDDPELMRTEFYGVGVYQAPSCVVGFPWVFTINNNARFGNHEGPSEIQLAVSRDLDQWDRQFREPILPHGDKGDWDCGFVCTASEAILVGDEVRLYYVGANYTHGSPCLYRAEGTGRGDPYTAGIGLATWKLNRFVSADGPKEGGTLTTAPLVTPHRTLTLNLAAGAEGVVEVEVLSIEGDEIAKSAPVSGNSLHAIVDFKEAEASFVDRPIQLRFIIKNAQLFSFGFE